MIGREGTPLFNRILSIPFNSGCRISNLETGAEVRTIKFGNYCWSIAVDKGQTLIAIGNGKKVTLQFVIGQYVLQMGKNEFEFMAYNLKNTLFYRWRVITWTSLEKSSTE